MSLSTFAHQSEELRNIAARVMNHSDQQAKLYQRDAASGAMKLQSFMEAKVAGSRGSAGASKQGTLLSNMESGNRMRVFFLFHICVLLQETTLF